MVYAVIKIFILSLFSLNIFASSDAICQQTLTKMGTCLALQSDFYDRINLKSNYKKGSDCIQGVDFFEGILKEDAKSISEIYGLQVRTTSDPLQRSSEDTLFGDRTDYCAGSISLKVRNEIKKVSLVYRVASHRGTDIPEITIEL